MGGHQRKPKPNPLGNVSSTPLGVTYVSPVTGKRQLNSRNGNGRSPKKPKPNPLGNVSSAPLGVTYVSPVTGKRQLNSRNGNGRSPKKPKPNPLGNVFFTIRCNLRKSRYR